MIVRMGCVIREVYEPDSDDGVVREDWWAWYRKQWIC